jgi:molybdopterin converting factor small subunit
LHGGIKKIIGCADLQLDEDLLSIKDVISYLESNFCSNNRIDESSILVAINGIEYSLLGGANAKVSSGDTVTILSIVHGG